jgi:5-(carboxyamino)imidazole ribonucleotide synthase
MSDYQSVKLGILGGGQLGRMLINPCVRYNVETYVLDPDAEASCKGVASVFRQGSFKDFDTVMDFAKDMDVVTIEIEHVNVDALAELEKQGKKVYPQPDVIRIVQDKGLQKQFYKENGIPTADFVLLGDETELPQHASFLPAFQKTRTGGYDGGGVKGMFSEGDFSGALKGPSLLEKAVDYQLEISVIVARNAAGETACHPAVEMVVHPEKNLLDFLASPARIPDEAAEKAKRIAIDVAEKINIVGILAVEMFLTKEGDVLVNEIAPRPHNSGHQTIEANITSQYEQLLRAIVGLPLGSTDALFPSVMINLLGEPGYDGPARYAGLEDALRIPGVYVHLYGKKFTRPFRKMGHVTVTGKDWESVLEKANEVRRYLKIIA